MAYKVEGFAKSHKPRVLDRFWAVLPTLLTASLCLIYIGLFIGSVWPYWFNPRWTSDDALQQLVPLHKVYHPEIFSGDLITDVMQGYLAPLHLGLSWLITWLTRDPIMTGHWVMLLQLSIVVLCIFALVRRYAGNTAAFFALFWLFHTRHLVQRTTAGLPRGWAPAILAATLLCMALRRQRSACVVLLLGCLLNPPATFLAGVAYGAFLLYGVARPQIRAESKRALLRLFVLGPLLAALTLYVTSRPPEIGKMASLAEAAEMPEFQRDGGRFAFLPFPSAVSEIKRYGFQAFIGKLYKPTPFWKKNVYFFALGTLALLLAVQLARRREVIPAELLIFLGAIFVVYFASRPLAFHLYLPDRHLRAPMAIFFIAAFSAGLWRVFNRGGGHGLTSRYLALGAYALLTVAILGAGGTGLEGSANFNYSNTKRGLVCGWLREHTPERALIAGFPTFIDPVPLFALRRAYATSETWHPFYSGYNTEIKRRLEISLRAHYAATLEELAQILTPERIDYFVFERARFYPEALEHSFYYEPLREMVKQVTSRPPDQYAYRALPSEVDLEHYPFMPFKDEKSVVVDVAKLNQYLKHAQE